MMRSATFVASLLALAACGGDGGTNPPPPPPVNAVASLTRADTSILAFTGKRVALRKLFIAKDANGNVLPNARPVCVTPSGFAIASDSLVAPTVEARGKLRCSATTIAAVSGLSRSSALAADPTDSMTVTAGIDLRAHSWTLAFKCNTRGSLLTDNNTPVDSIGYERATVDSISYPLDANFVSQWGGVAQLWYHGSLIRWLHPGGADTITVIGQNGQILAQLPDTLVVTANAGAPVGVKAPLTMNGTLRSYTGGSFCNGFQALDAMRVDEVAQ